MNELSVSNERQILVRRQFCTILIVLGTVLAGLGWLMELRGLDDVLDGFSRSIAHLILWIPSALIKWQGWGSVASALARFVSLPLIGHALQVAGIFGLMLTPDLRDESALSKDEI